MMEKISDEQQTQGAGQSGGQSLNADEHGAGHIGGQSLNAEETKKALQRELAASLERELAAHERELTASRERELAERELAACRERELAACRERELAAHERELAANRVRELDHERELAAMSKKWRLCNPPANMWDAGSTDLQIYARGLVAVNEGQSSTLLNPNVFAMEPFAGGGYRPIFCVHLNYYEVKVVLNDGKNAFIGLSADKDSPTNHNKFIGEYANSYSIRAGRIRSHLLAGVEKEFAWPPGAVRPTLSKTGEGNVFGCGLLTCPNGSRFIFFTANGTLLGSPIPIGTVDVPLYPAVTVDFGMKVEAIFGSGGSNSFAYDVDKCTGLNLESE